MLYKTYGKLRRIASSLQYARNQAGIIANAVSAQCVHSSLSAKIAAKTLYQYGQEFYFRQIPRINIKELLLVSQVVVVLETVTYQGILYFSSTEEFPMAENPISTFCISLFASTVLTFATNYSTRANNDRLLHQPSAAAVKCITAQTASSIVSHAMISIGASFSSSYINNLVLKRFTILSIPQ